MGQDRRADADGLRGIAILSVLVFHALPASLPGGFAGVDVFFVLSGFLVGRQILLDCRRGTFSFFEFYARRARRLFPSLLLVLSATLVGAAFIVGPDDLVQIGNQAAASVVFIANFLAWAQSGYFDGEAGFRPLIHLWSLGIEEQFYLFLPVALVMVSRRAPGRMGTALVVAAIASFVACVATTAFDKTAAFYLPATRFWEFLAGTLLARWQLRGQGKFPVPANALAVAGSLLLAATFAALSGTDDYPGWRAVLPVGGTCLVLAAGPHAWINRNILCDAFLRWMGKISYAAYLWHWPVLVLARLHLGRELRPIEAVALTALSVLVAWASTELVEQPFRLRPWARKRWVTVALWSSCAVVGATAVAVTRYVDAGTPLELARLERYPGPTADPWREGFDCFINLNKDRLFGERCLGGAANERPLAVLWGDSHAAHLWPGLDSASNDAGWRLAQLTVSQCPGLVTAAGEGNQMCAVMRERALATIALLRPDTVVISNRWTFYDPEEVMRAVQPTVAWLKSNGVRRVVVIGPFPNWQPTLAKSLAADMRVRHLKSPPDATVTGLQAREFEMEAPLRSASARSGAIYVSALERLCTEERECKAWVDPGKSTLMTFDNAHLTVEGSIWFVRALAPELLRPE